MGIEVRENSMRLHFTFEGVKQKPTLKVDGKPMAPTPRNIKYAERLLDEINDKIRLGVFSFAEYFPDNGTSGRGTTVGTQLDTWLASQRIESSTRDGYASAIRFWKKAPADKSGAKLGDRALRALKHSDILYALASRPTLAGKTVNNYVSVLREAMHLALLDKSIQSSPVADIPRAKHQKDPPDPFDLDEAEAIIAYAREKYPEPIYNMIESWFFTGYRTSEVAGLKWTSFDQRRGELLIHEALVRGEAKDKTKTGVARTVKLNSRALAALKRQKAHTFLKFENVFLDPRYGEPWNEERAFRRSYWTPALKALGIRYRRPYNMRHTYATMLLMAGATPAWAAKQLGHSVEMFLSTYAKWIDGGHNDLELGRLESFIGAGSSPEVPQTSGRSR